MSEAANTFKSSMHVQQKFYVVFQRKTSLFGAMFELLFFGTFEQNQSTKKKKLKSTQTV